MKIEVGKTYKTNGGGDVHIDHMNGSNPRLIDEFGYGPFYSKEYGLYHEDGRFGAGDIPKLNIAHEVGTLAELNVKAGDVVEYTVGKAHHMTLGKKYEVVNPQGIIMDHGEWWSGSTGSHAFRIISRADTTTQSPKTWGEMTDAEKGALLLAKYEGATVQVLDGETWVSNPVSLHGKFAYRIKPEPKLCKQSLPIKPNKFGDYVTMHGVCDTATHRITFDTIDGKPDCDSVKMEAM